MGILIDLQTKIYTILSADATLQTLLGGSGRVIDRPADNLEPPFVQIGEDERDDFGAHDVDGHTFVVTIHTWTEAEGRKTCKEIQDRIYTLLHDVDLAITGQKTISLRAGLTTSMLDPDGRTHHGVSRFNLILGG